MSKYLKRISAALLGICLTVCLGIFAAACSGSGEFKVTVLDPDGKPMENMQVQLCKSDEAGNLGLCLTPQLTDKDGVAVIDLTTQKDATYFVIHILNADGYDYEQLLVNVKKKSKATVNLTKATSKAAFTDSVTVSLENEQSIQEYKPAIEVAGFYTITSSYPFNAEVSEHKTQGSYSVIAWLNVGDSYKISAYPDYEEYTYDNDGNISFIINVKQNMNEGGSEAPISVSSGAAVILNLKANQTVYFENPKQVNNHEGANVIVGGTNFKSGEHTQAFAVASGKSFGIATADGKAGKVVLDISAPVDSTTVTVGQKADFSVQLITSKENPEWISDTYFIDFTITQEGEYSIAIQSDFATDSIEIKQVGSTGIVSLFPDAIKDSEKAEPGQFSAKYNLTIPAGDNSITYRIYLISNGDYTSFKDGDKINYSVTVTKS